MNKNFYKIQVIARLTVTRANGWRTIVEVCADASFHKFYAFYRQQGAMRSTKQLIRTANRNEGLPAVNAHLYRPGLDVIARRLEAYGAQDNPVSRTTLRIIKKRLYRKLISCMPDELGLVKVPSNRIPMRRFSPTHLILNMERSSNVSVLSQ